MIQIKAPPMPTGHKLLQEMAKFSASSARSFHEPRSMRELLLLEAEISLDQGDHWIRPADCEEAPSSWVASMQLHAVLPIAFIMHGETGEKVYIGGDTWQLAQILVLGLMTDQGLRPIEPTIQWSAFHVKDRARSAVRW